jgi:hypothetical protein
VRTWNLTNLGCKLQVLAKVMQSCDTLHVRQLGVCTGTSKSPETCKKSRKSLSLSRSNILNCSRT